ncbi:hypothetical protein MFUM_910004 [Methylacidiphilum fumariolicum SolV]|uniref:Uncharacterized protein n=2 Tax=Candidatus Methylacidiphilum fumarolicum TaxID=591154 RepID=I0K0P2_METFB|nr:conserved protein of unknown function [Candidatus Methylacidiphilum fumarolicum]CCG93061.1 hypothetical protein MFUM_910004 [Methylacidiphilum fumariolicum SolV]
MGLDLTWDPKVEKVSDLSPRSNIDSSSPILVIRQGKEKLLNPGR